MPFPGILLLLVSVRLMHPETMAQRPRNQISRTPMDVLVLLLSISPVPVGELHVVKYWYVKS